MGGVLGSALTVGTERRFAHAPSVKVLPRPRGSGSQMVRRHPFVSRRMLESGGFAPKTRPPLATASPPVGVFA